MWWTFPSKRDKNLTNFSNKNTKHVYQKQNRKTFASVNRLNNVKLNTIMMAETNKQKVNKHFNAKLSFKSALQLQCRTLVVVEQPQLSVIGKTTNWRLENIVECCSLPFYSNESEWMNEHLDKVVFRCFGCEK